MAEAPVPVPTAQIVKPDGQASEQLHRLLVSMQQRVKTLETELTALKARVAALEAA